MTIGLNWNKSVGLSRVGSAVEEKLGTIFYLKNVSGFGVTILTISGLE